MKKVCTESPKKKITFLNILNLFPEIVAEEAQREDGRDPDQGSAHALVQPERALLGSILLIHSGRNLRTKPKLVKIEV
jgi:hypothetical protein